MYRKLPGSHDNVLAYEFTDEVTEEEFHEIITEVREVIDEYGDVRLLARMPEMPSQPFFSTLGERLRFLRDDIGGVERYALVSDDTKAEWIGKIADKITPIEFRHFPSEEEPEAWLWVSAQTAKR